VDNDAIRKEAERILKDADFHQAKPDNPFEELLKFLADHFKMKMPPVEKTFGNRWIGESLGGFLQILFYGLLAALAIWVIYWLWKKISAIKQTKKPAFKVSQAERQEARSQYLQQAEQAAQTQDYRLAIHCLFLAAVTQTIRDTDFHRAEFLTNRELANTMDFSGFQSSTHLSHLFNEMLQLDEPRWFGKTEASLSHYDSMRSLHSDFSTQLTFKSIGDSQAPTGDRRYA
jgi:hypothetical protein